MPKIQVPDRLVRSMGDEIDVDVAKRILKRVQFVTRKIASDGGIVVPDGINTKFFEMNPVVLDRHARSDTNGGSSFPVVGRSLSLAITAVGMEGETQFADTERGREIAYLYGVNAEKEVYARGWSFGWRTDALETWTLDHAKEWLGSDWDETLVPPSAKRYDEVWVALRSTMNEYSVVPLGADRLALSRAYSDKNIRLAGEWVLSLDLSQAQREIAALRSDLDDHTNKLDVLERNIQALSRDGAAAVGRGDSAELLDAVRSLTELAKGRKTNVG